MLEKKKRISLPYFIFAKYKTQTSILSTTLAINCKTPISNRKASR